MPLAVFRFDASPSLGTGHAVRCLALARTLAVAGWRVRVAASRQTFETVAGAGAFAPIALDGAVDGEPRRIGAAVGSADLLVIDHYGREAAFEADCRRWARRILVIDDLGDRRHDCDALMDQTPGRQNSVYRALVPQHCRLLLGSAYAALRPEFRVRRPEALRRRESTEPPQRILLSLGGTDAGDTTRRTMEALARSGVKASVDVVVGAAAPYAEAVGTCAQDLGDRFRVHQGVNDMATLMTETDIAVGAAGTTALERCCLGLPALMLVLADNQAEVAAALAKAGAALLLPGIDAVPAAVARLCGDAALRRSMSLAAAALCDGRGVWRVVLGLVDPVATELGAVRLRLAEPGDEAVMLEWQRHPQVRRYARNPEPPTPETHRAWVRSKLADPNCLLTIVELEAAAAVGVVRLDHREHDGAHEVSILVSPDCHGQGIGSAALRLIRAAMPGSDLVARVLPENHASVRAFRKAGYEPLGDGWFRSRPDGLREAGCRAS